MSVLRRQRRVSLHLQRGQLKSETSLWNVYVQISSAPHTLPIAHSQCHLQSYTFTAQSMGGELCFHGVFIWLMGRKKTRIYWSTMWPPGDKQGECRSSAEVFLSIFFCSFSLLLSAVLSFCSHTVWAFHCEVCSWFKEDTAHWSCIKFTRVRRQIPAVIIRVKYWGKSSYDCGAQSIEKLYLCKTHWPRWKHCTT